VREEVVGLQLCLRHGVSDVELDNDVCHYQRVDDSLIQEVVLKGRQAPFKCASWLKWHIASVKAAR